MRPLEQWVFLRIQGFRLTYKTHSAEWQGHIVGFREGALLLKNVEEMLANSGMGTVGTNENVAVMGSVI